MLHRLKVARTEHHARHAHRVDTLACGEREAVAVQAVALVVVLNGVAKVDGVGGVGN